MARKKAEETTVAPPSLEDAIATLQGLLPEAIADAPDDRIRAALLRVEHAVESVPWAYWTQNALNR